MAVHYGAKRVFLDFFSTSGGGCVTRQSFSFNEVDIWRAAGGDRAASTP